MDLQPPVRPVDLPPPELPSSAQMVEMPAVLAWWRRESIFLSWE